MKISVVIPAYNEESVIAQTIDEVKTWLKKKFASFEIIVVDDGSGDHTLEILKNTPEIKLLRNLRNHGKGYTVSKGVAAATGEWILFMDADSSTNIKELAKLWSFIGQYQLIIGSRATSGAVITQSQAGYKVLLGRLGNLLIRLLVAPGISDTQCGFKLFDRRLKPLFAKLTITDWGFDFELISLARKANFRIKEVPIVWQNNTDSKVSLASYLRTLAELFKLKIKNFKK